MIVNAKVDMAACLRELPGLPLTYQTAWKIRLLQLQGQSLALSALRQWFQHSPSAYEEILIGIRLVGVARTPPTLPAVEKSPAFPVHAICAKSHSARLFFFYVAQINTVVCTNCVGSDIECDLAEGYRIAEALRVLFYHNLTPPVPLT